MSDKIRVILFKGEEAWVAQGLEHDICVQGSTLDDLYGRFDVAVRLEAKEPGGLQRISAAPKYYFDLWDKKAGEYTPSSDSDGCYEFGLAA